MRRTDRTAAAPVPDASADKPSHRVRLPGFVTGDEIGLGDVIKSATSYVGLQSCRGCARRAAALNRWLSFGRGPGRPGNG